MNLPVRIALLFTSFLLAPRAAALCATVASESASFGDISSNRARTAVQSTSTINAGLRCSGNLLSVLRADDHVYMTVTSSGTGLIGPTGDVLNYNIYATNRTDPAYVINRSTQYDMARNSIMDLLGALGSTVPVNVPLYFGTITGGNPAAGVYSETLSLYWDWNYCTGYDSSGICTGRDINSGTVPLTVSMTVSNDCTISAPNISFGDAPVVAAFPTVNQSVGVSCTKGSPYTVGLGGGQNPNGGRRHMASGSGPKLLAYDIFKSAGTTVWGSIGSARRSSADADVNPGNGLGAGSQTFNYNARIYLEQATPPAGSYADTITVDVTF